MTELNSRLRPAFFLLVIFNTLTINFIPSHALALLSLSQGKALPSKTIEVADYKPPKGIGTPETVGGGTRGGKCEQDEKSAVPLLTALMPDLIPDTAEFGVTVSESPQFFVYLPETSARKAEFVLKDENEKDLYRSEDIPISGQSSIVSVSLPKEQIKLEPGKNYHWYFSVICNPDNRRKDIFVEGWTQHTEMSLEVASQIQKAAPQERAKLYAEAGIWHEAVATLAELRRETPDDPALAQEWQTLLESAGLKQMAELSVDLPFTMTVLESSP
ncbi:DUF928 domain-containing protein [Microcoleus sp. FACHB-672]|uniref:DUF928 domain-containing protein n=1 Tax=Microcoleus sp. FACHB-672 TaxID=2692825 RepID=UPI00168829C9|nr:DUF928 domain-containing protein [Microcoleus sp. FACHB-672]MBD2041066.1 DUF928 domain-containing protein [Microcoleus sp. FACHB-672]